jgi:prophage regulatory protein
MVKPLYIELNELPEIIKLAPATVQRLVRLGQFPAPRQLSPHRVAWLFRELEDWSESRPVSNLPPPPNTGKGKGSKVATALPMAQDEHPV